MRRSGSPPAWRSRVWIVRRVRTSAAYRSAGLTGGPRRSRPRTRGRAGSGRRRPGGTHTTRAARRPPAAEATADGRGGSAGRPKRPGRTHRSLRPRRRRTTEQGPTGRRARECGLEDADGDGRPRRPGRPPTGDHDRGRVPGQDCYGTAVTHVQDRSVRDRNVLLHCVGTCGSLWRHRRPGRTSLPWLPADRQQTPGVEAQALDEPFARRRGRHERCQHV